MAELAAGLMGPAAHGWPEVELEWTTPLAEPPGSGSFGAERCVLPLLSGGHAVFERERRVARFHKSVPADGHEIAHPCLSAVGLVFARWDGRLALHAGGVVVDGVAWGVLGAKEAGKSTTLAWMADAGFGIVADDLLVLEGGCALAGPRTIDLRPPAAERLEGRALLEVRQGQRKRVLLPVVAPELPLGGFVVLGVGDEPSVEAVPAASRLETLSRHLTLRQAGLPASGLLEVVGLPMWRMHRSRVWADLPRLVDRLLTVLAA